MMTRSASPRGWWRSSIPRVIASPHCSALFKARTLSAYPGEADRGCRNNLRRRNGCPLPGGYPEPHSFATLGHGGQVAQRDIRMARDDADRLAARRREKRRPTILTVEDELFIS